MVDEAATRRRFQEQGTSRIVFGHGKLLLMEGEKGSGEKGKGVGRLRRNKGGTGYFSRCDCRRRCDRPPAMPRIPRGQQAGFVYHVINRGNGRATIFHKAQDYFGLRLFQTFQWFDGLTMSGFILNRYASFKSFQANAGSRRSKLQGSRQFKGSTFNDHILSGSSRFSTARQGQTPTFLNDPSLDALFLKDSD